MGDGIYSSYFSGACNDEAWPDGKGGRIKYIVAADLVHLFPIFIFQNLLMKRTCMLMSTNTGEPSLRVRRSQNSQHGV